MNQLGLRYNEFVVYSEKLVKIRYIVDYTLKN